MGWASGVVMLVLAEWGLTDCVWGAVCKRDFLRRCLPAARALCGGGAALLALGWARALRGWRAPDFGVRHGRSGRCGAGFKVSSIQARGNGRACFFYPFRAGFPIGGATADSARTRSRDLSLENPIGCRAPSPCCNASWAAPAREPPGVLFVFPFQSKTRQSPPAPCSWGGRASLIRGSSGRAHCAQGAELMVSEMRFSMASMP